MFYQVTFYKFSGKFFTKEFDTYNEIADFLCSIPTRNVLQAYHSKGLIILEFSDDMLSVKDMPKELYDKLIDYVISKNRKVK